jgi:hypothetical protein
LPAPKTSAQNTSRRRYSTGVWIEKVGVGKNLKLKSKKVDVGDNQKRALGLVRRIILVKTY